MKSKIISKHFFDKLILFGAFILSLTFAIRVFVTLHSNNPVVSIVVLKLPRSGSSWFTEKLNDMTEVFVSKEILQRDDVGRFARNSIELRLSKALLVPTGDSVRLNLHLHVDIFPNPDKVAASSSLWPNGRFIEDYWMRLKCFSNLQFVGFTINPEHCQGSSRPPHCTIHIVIFWIFDRS